MKKSKQSVLSWDVALLAAWIVLLASLVVLFFTHRMWFYILAGIAAVAAGLAIWKQIVRRKTAVRYLSRIAQHLNQVDADGLENSPFAAVAVSATGEILWYNRLMQDDVLQRKEAIGEDISLLIGDDPMQTLARYAQFDAKYQDRKYTVLKKQVAFRESVLYILYFWDNTKLKKIAEEYEKSRTVVLSLYIDNLDELIGDLRDSERAQIAGHVETMLEDWIGSFDGLFRKYQHGRFLAMIEQRHLQAMLEDRFSILDAVRAEKMGDVTGVTLSIGVGQGETLHSSAQMAQQALEMALGRGGDQAAVRTQDGFDFYGGISRGVERRTKVRTRVIAAALRERIEQSECVLVMGHRFSDLDAIGSAAALAQMARKCGKPAYVAVNRASTLAAELLEHYEHEGLTDLFVDETQAMEYCGKDTLLIVTDTHNPKMLEFPSLYEATEQVVVMDHHRKMVDYIDNAVLFFHEPYASSVSEMVTELAQYMDGITMSRVEAEGLLSGIVLDTRSFSMKTGVRTFEAAAYLRKQGADTVAVKKMFAGSIELYRRKTDIMARAEMYRNTVIAGTEESGTEVRVAAAQAANELLSIKGVEAAFTLFRENDGINISARSYGDFNVQLVMELLGGGGHLAMAGAYLPHTEMADAVEQLKHAISERLAEWEQSRPTE